MTLSLLLLPPPAASDYSIQYYILFKYDSKKRRYPIEISFAVWLRYMYGTGWRKSLGFSSWQKSQQQQQQFYVTSRKSDFSLTTDCSNAWYVVVRIQETYWRKYQYRSETFHLLFGGLSSYIHGVQKSIQMSPFSFRQKLSVLRWLQRYAGPLK